ncbi:Metal tolerance protein 10 [Trichinella britovi]|uniref:Metal tolerance protein 10 n=1 Tax=Trichinella britovi TaxID=45882 RepID=A0A0V1D356_TRIBR|nr:Metal tolerance protein 10 [Trichinella britovi]
MTRPSFPTERRHRISDKLSILAVQKNYANKKEKQVQPFLYHIYFQLSTDVSSAVLLYTELLRLFDEHHLVWSSEFLFNSAFKATLRYWIFCKLVDLRLKNSPTLAPIDFKFRFPFFRLKYSFRWAIKFHVLFDLPTMSSNENTPLSPPGNLDFTALLEKAAKECKDRNARQYYRRQLKLLHNFQKDRAHVNSLQNNQVDSSETLKSSSTVASMRLAKVTLFFNLALLVVKLVAAVLSGSFSVVSSVVDSAVDITSGLIIWLTSRAIKRRDLSVYPRGRTRLEPLALILISFIMGSASIQVIGKSVEAIISRNIKPDVQINTIAIMVTTVVVKAVLWILCDCFKDANSKVLAQDHRNDCISNSSAILFAFLGDRYWVYLDPIGAILVSLYLLATWIATGYKQVSIISGKAASPWIVSRITKICLDHDERCKHIDTVLVYHFGVRYLVEVHIVLDENITLKEAHDISEPLQRKIEHLPYVERAFVHVDYEFDHRPEDEHKIV